MKKSVNLVSATKTTQTYFIVLTKGKTITKKRKITLIKTNIHNLSKLIA